MLTAVVILASLATVAFIGLALAGPKCPSCGSYRTLPDGKVWHRCCDCHRRFDPIRDR